MCSDSIDIEYVPPSPPSAPVSNGNAESVDNAKTADMIVTVAKEEEDTEEEEVCYGEEVQNCKKMLTTSSLV